MSIYSSISSLARLRDQALLADYANAQSKDWHLKEFRIEMLRLLSGTFISATETQLWSILRANILKTLSDANQPVTPAQADLLIGMLINTPISDPLLSPIPKSTAIAAE